MENTNLYELITNLNSGKESKDYILGQASVIAGVLSMYIDNDEFHQMQRQLRKLMQDNDDLLQAVLSVKFKISK